MTVDIYLRSYPGDYNWLPYLFVSIRKYVTGFRRLVITHPEDVPGPVPTNAFPITVIPVPREHRNDYIGQQLSKLQAHKHTDANYILYVDSDVVFSRPCNALDMAWSSYSVLGAPWETVGDAQCWRESTERLLGFATTHETMRRLPVVYERELVESCWDHLADRNGNSLFTVDRMSEFNLLGNYAAHVAQWTLEDVTHPDSWLPPPVARQFWSWGKLESAIDEIKQILGEDCP